MDKRNIVMPVVARLGMTLKDKQMAFLSGEDVFLTLPTSKSFMFLLPWIFNELKGALTILHQ